jgi:hypothetical protein
MTWDSIAEMAGGWGNRERFLVYPFLWCLGSMVLSWGMAMLRSRRLCSQHITITYPVWESVADKAFVQISCKTNRRLLSSRACELA